MPGRWQELSPRAQRRLKVVSMGLGAFFVLLLVISIFTDGPGDESVDAAKAADATLTPSPIALSATPTMTPTMRVGPSASVGPSTGAAARTDAMPSADGTAEESEAEERAERNAEPAASAVPRTGATGVTGAVAATPAPTGPTAVERSVPPSSPAVRRTAEAGQPVSEIDVSRRQPARPAEPTDVEAAEAEPAEAEPAEAEPAEAEPADAGLVDVGPIDLGPIDVGPMEDAAPGDQPRPVARQPVAPTRSVEQPPAVHYANCDAARAAGAAPLRAGQPGYRAALDRDGDGVACE